MRKSGWTTVVALLLAGAAQAAPFQNGDFEIGTAPGAFTQVNPGSPAITGWTVINSSVDYIGTYWNAASGSRSIDVSGSGGANSGLEQGFDTIAGTTYDVTFALAGNPDCGPAIKPLTVTAVPPATTQNYNFDTTGRSRPANMGWVDQSFSFTATGTTTTLRFTTPNTTACGPALDNVRVVARAAQVAPVPTTSEWGLLLLASLMAGLALRRHARRTR